MKKNIIIALVLLVGIFSCKKNKEDIDPNAPSPSQVLNDIYKETKSEQQLFEVMAGEYVTIQGKGGLIIRFHPESFLDKDRNIINREPLYVFLTEVLTYKDMVRNRVQTVTRDGTKLISGGAYKIEAYYAGQDIPVYCNYYEVNFKAPNPLGSTTMALFKGYEEPSIGGAIIKWENDTMQNVTLGDIIDTSNTVIPKAGFKFDSCFSFGWVNCDMFLNDPNPKSDLKVVFPDDSYNLSNTEVVVMMPRINAALGMTSYQKTNRAFSLGGAERYQLPISLGKVDVLTVTIKNGKSYFYQQNDVILSRDSSYIYAEPKEMPVAEIVNILKSL